jgi:S1-C subfamily serine protease
MMKTLKLFVIGAFFFSFSSCGKKEKVFSQDEIYNYYKNSVVLINMAYVYKIKVGSEVFYAGRDNIGSNPKNLAPYSGTGTGFFVGTDGMIATNRHVAYPLTKEEATQIEMNVRQRFNKSLAELENRRDNVNNAIVKSDSYYEVYSLYSRKNDMTEAITNLRTYANSDMEVEIENVFLGIALHDSEIDLDNKDEYITCKFVAKADNDKHDLALIQTKNRKLPEGVTNIFKIKPTKKLMPPAEVYVFGYNWGEKVGKTDQGLKVQITKGAISQEGDDTDILYSAPTLKGSSGGAVVDKSGNLVAINYAGYSSTQSYNYGILVKHLGTLLEKINKENEAKQ